MDEKITVKEAAEILGYHINHVYRLLAEGTVLQGEKFGNTWIIDKDHVMQVKSLQDENGRIKQN